MRRAGATFLAAVAGDPELLGEQRLLRDCAAERLAELTAAQWADVLSMRFADAARPMLRHEVTTLLTAAGGGDVIDLLAVVAADSPALAEVGEDQRFPISLFRSASCAPAVAPLGFDVADGHLHTGASMPLTLAFRALGTRASPVKSKDPLIWLGPTGQRWDLTLLLCACRWSLRLLWHLRYFRPKGIDDLASDGLSADVIRAVTDGKFWKIVYCRATTGSWPADESFGSHDLDAWEKLLNRRFEERSLMPEVDQLFWSGVAPPPACAVVLPRSFFLGFMRAAALLSGVIMSGRGEGLTRFAERFQFMGQIKKAGFKDRELAYLGTTIVTETLERIASTDDVLGAEFRKTVTEDAPKPFLREILDSLAEHHRGFAKFAEKQAISLTMPVGFLRRRAGSSCPAEASAAELRHVMSGCEALQVLAGREGGDILIRAVHSMDVADDEIGSSNWPFQLGAEILARLPLRFTIHAGESFVSPLNGVRRVGELFMGAVAPERVGHALALSTAAARYIADTSCPVVRSEAIMDLAWVISAGVGPVDEARLLLRLLTTPVDATAQIDVAHWETAFVALHTLEGVMPVLVDRDGESYRAVAPDDVVAIARSRGEAGITLAALAGHASRLPIGFNLSSRLTGNALKDYFEICDACYEDARLLVLQMLAEAGTVIETCPTSNLLLAGLGGYASHPLWSWHLDHSQRLSVSSDDPLIFGSTVVDEFRQLIEADVDRDAVEAIAELSVEQCSGGRDRLANALQDYHGVVKLLGGKRDELDALT